MLALLFGNAVGAAGIDAGKVIVLQGNGKANTACIACHGAEGAGNAQSAFPRLARLNASYLARQIRDFQRGARKDVLMPPVAQALSEAQIADVTAYFAAQCSLCHGENGAGTQVDAAYVFPPLWGKDSFNWGAGMHRVDTAAGFIKANMPLGKPNSLSDQEAWDVASFINSRERPQDPRFSGDVAATKKTYHAENCHYGELIDGQVLGAEKK